MNVEIISVGTELLLGDTLDTNSNYLSQQVKNLGFNLYKKVTVGDNHGRLLKEIKEGLQKVDLIITTGGLGPTNDDITKEVVMEALNVEPVIHKESYMLLLKYFGDNKEAVEVNRKQALFPKDAIILENHNGTAPGAIMFGKGKMVMVLPGPPREMIPMFENYGKPYLQEKSDGIIYSETLNISSLGEWKMAEMARGLAESCTNPTVAPYAKKTGNILKITAKAPDEHTAKSLIEPVKNRLYGIFGKFIYGENGESRQEAVYKLLKEKGLTIVTAESITGGMIASRLVDVSGISDYLKESLVVYSDRAKIKYLGVKNETLERYSAESEEVCKEMLDGLSAYGYDISLVTTGFAGPTGDNPGLAFIGIEYKGKKRIVEVHYNGSRNDVRERVTRKALEEVRFLILEE